MRRRDVYYNWPRFHTPAIEWWGSLSIDEKNKAKSHFLKVREWNIGRKTVQYPNMYDITHLRISQLTDKHIVRIHTFKDHKTEW